MDPKKERESKQCLRGRPTVDLSPGAHQWLQHLGEQGQDLSDQTVQHAYVLGVLTAAIERLESLDTYANRRPLSEALQLGNVKFPEKERIDTEGWFPQFIVEHSAKAWLKGHPASKLARVIAEDGMSAPLEVHIRLVGQMYRESERMLGLPTIDPMFSVR